MAVTGRHTVSDGGGTGPVSQIAGGPAVPGSERSDGHSAAGAVVRATVVGSIGALWPTVFIASRPPPLFEREGVRSASKLQIEPSGS